MSKTMFHLIWKNYAEKAAYRHVEAIARYHRIQAHPGIGMLQITFWIL